MQLGELLRSRIRYLGPRDNLRLEIETHGPNADITEIIMYSIFGITFLVTVLSAIFLDIVSDPVGFWTLMIIVGGLSVFLLYGAIKGIADRIPLRKLVLDEHGISLEIPRETATLNWSELTRITSSRVESRSGGSSTNVLRFEADVVENSISLNEEHLQRGFYGAIFRVAAQHGRANGIEIDDQLGLQDMEESE